jgi:hypothetical protein
MSVGFPNIIKLEEFGSKVWDAFGGPPYHVGSSMLNKTGWRDVDVRMILDDAEYLAMGFGDPKRPQQNAKWVAMCTAFSALGREMTGLPIDFQIQQQTYANETEDKPRSAIGIVPWRLKP